MTSRSERCFKKLPITGCQVIKTSICPLSRALSIAVGDSSLLPPTSKATALRIRLRIFSPFSTGVSLS